MQTFLRRCLLFIALLACSAAAFAQTCALPGLSGPITLGAGTTYINSYHGGIGSTGANATVINVSSATGQRSNTRQLLAGDMILVMQMQDSTNGGNAGLHEYAQIASITGTAITLTKPLVNSYNQLMNTTNVRSWQVIWVPQYSALTVTGTAGANSYTVFTPTGVATGGVLAMDVAGSLTLNGTATASGMGFRGAFGLSGSGIVTGGTATTANVPYSTSTTLSTINGGQKGEGTMGTPPRVFAGTVFPFSYTVLLNQGYALGAGGQASIGNAGGGSNDGNPADVGSSNSYNAGGGGGGGYSLGGRGGNSWNDGTSTNAVLNQNTNTNVGNVAGGQGGNGQASVATRLVMGGGGGAGAANNGSVANGLTAWPPTNAATDNGATGPITSSGASGGGVVLIRAGSVAGTGRVLAAGYKAYNKWPLGDTDSGGGGGGGGSIFFVATTGNGAGMTLDASGGNGGFSNYFQHGPGGGGGGGYIETTLTGAATNVAGGPNGTEACCGVGAPGNGSGISSGSPKAWNALAGTAGAVDTSPGTPTGLGGGGGACLPIIAVTKSTSTPNVTSTGATARYSINLSNTGGGASNVFILDAALPPGWTYSTTPPTTYTYNPAPGGAVAPNADAAGAENVSATVLGPFPINTLVQGNSITAVTLRANGAAPAVIPTNGTATVTLGSFYLPSQGSITVSFAVTIPNAATVGTYHNPAGVIFLDATRTTTVARMVSPLTDVSANRAAIAYSANTAYASGGTANVAGSNYSGLAGGPGTEDVTLQPDFSVTKSINTPTFTLGATGLRYIIALRNAGRPIDNQVYINTQATSQSATAIIGTPVISDTMPTGMTITALNNNDPVDWTCTPNATSTTFTCSVGNGAFPMTAASNVVTVTATITVSSSACPSPQPNTVSVTTTTLGDVTPANNTATFSTPIDCRVNLTVSKVNSVTTVMAGSTTSYTITFANLGPATADGALALDTPSAGLSCTVSNCAQSGTGVCPVPGLWPDLLGGGLTLTSFPTGATLTFSLSCTVTATGS